MKIELNNNATFVIMIIAFVIMILAITYFGLRCSNPVEAHKFHKETMEEVLVPDSTRLGD